ncbi:MAG: hypothetical protein OXP71_11915 [Candidatus Poribacteria bacterium]|nr:hypothetical protein [Candidatus Poribacteria bacterium]
MRTAIQNQPEDIIESRLVEIRRRMHLNSFLSHLARFGFWGLLLAGILLILNRLIPLPIPVSLAAPLPLAVGFAAALCLCLLRKSNLFAVARTVDTRLNLKERLSTAFEAIQRGKPDDDFVPLQIKDAAHVARAIVPAASFPYTFPPSLKWTPIALLLITSAFVIPQMYEPPPPLSAAEIAAIDQAAETLESELNAFPDTELARKIRDTIGELRHSDIDANRSQAELSALRDEIRAKKSLVESGITSIAKTISEADTLSKHFKGNTAGEIASDIEKLAAQMNGLPPGQRAELEALLKKIAQSLGDNPAMENLTNQLAELQTEAVSAEMLQRIAQALLQSTDEIAQLDELLQQIRTNRRNIALAGIELDRKASGVAGSGSGSGKDSDAEESQDTMSGSKPQPLNPPSDNSLTDLELTATPSDSQAFTQVYVDEDPTGQGEPTYMPYREVYLHAQQAYAQAIERDEIPVKYREQVKAYLEAIANLDNKDSQ